MKKKLISIVLALVLGLSMLAFTACNGNGETDLSSLLERIEQLEQELAEARELGGIPGPAGQDGRTPRIVAGYWWIGDTNTHIRAEGQDGQGTPGVTPHIGSNGNWWIGNSDTNIRAGVQMDRVYTLGQTFTYVSSQGLRLFSIRVVADASAMGGFAFYVTNINMPSNAPSTFIRLRLQEWRGGGVFFFCIPPPLNKTFPIWAPPAWVAFGKCF